MAKGAKIITLNRKARHDYEIVDTIEVGLELKGSEVKSLRAGEVNLKDSYARVEKGEVFLVGCHISPYTHGSLFNPDPLRPRKLLLHKDEIRRLERKIVERGYTLIPLSLYFRRGKAKVELALAKGKTLVDKRETIKRKTAKREMERELKHYRYKG
jgi:SsrA-binding protein